MKQQFVLDNSVAMAWCFEDERGQYSISVLRILGMCEAFVPSFWPLEVGNALIVAERRKRIDKVESDKFIERLNLFPINIEIHDPKRIFSEIVPLAREHQLSTYDAAYLDLALRRNLPIAALDASIVKAAKKCRIALFKP